MSSFAMLQQWYNEVWNNANDTFIDEMMHKDVVVHGLDPTGTSHGIAHFRTFYANFRKSFPVITTTLQHLVSDADTAAAYIALTGRSAAGREVNFSGLCVGKFASGQMVEVWNNFDFLKMYQQLGHILVSHIGDPPA